LEHLIPDSWFVGQPQGLLLLFCVGAILVLGKGADWLVDGAAALAYRMGLSKVIVGATIVSLGTTSPEAAVSVMAAWSGQPGLALGNAVGSIIADTGLIFGIGCMIAVLPADRYLLARQGWVQFGSAALLAAIAYGSWIVLGDQAVLGRWVGVLFLVLLVAYMAVSVRWSHRDPEDAPFVVPDDAPDPAQAARRSAAFLVALLVVGLTLVLLASRTLIGSVTELAEAHWHIPQVVIAATLVAFGTSLPELVIGLASVVKGHREILVGNVIGADILNVLFVIGASAVAAPLPILDPAAKLPAIALQVHIPSMLIILVLFRVFIFTASGRGEFRRWQGIPLVALYVAYVVIQFVLS
jgi:cation:H+ antiporter